MVNNERRFMLATKNAQHIGNLHAQADSWPRPLVYVTTLKYVDSSKLKLFTSCVRRFVSSVDL
jgi:hypothetical protein